MHNHSNYKIKNSMNQYRHNAESSSSKTRTTGFKSPSSHDPSDAKMLKKKIDRQSQELERQKQRNKELEQIIAQMSKKLEKQQRQIAKKQQIQDVLLQQISQLKNELEDSRSIKTNSKQNSLEEKRSLDKKSFEHQNSNNSGRVQSKANGYNFTLSDLNGGDNNTYQSDYSQQSSNFSLKSFEGQNRSDQSSSSAKVGGYFASIFSK